MLPAISLWAIFFTFHLLSVNGEVPQNDVAAQEFSSVIPQLLGRALQPRQGKVCSIPGGPICDSIHCCRPGEQCCPTGCCPVTSSCFGAGRCCPSTGTRCPGDTACCPPGATCCGSTCCLAGEFCERGHCIDETLKDRVVKFDLDNKKNKELLKNMCEGMKRGNGGVARNTEVLTYRGKEVDYPRDAVRAAAGCVDGYCRDIITAGGNPLFDSCDEYPPASTMEGGNFRLPTERIITCIPRNQNSRQGNRISRMLQAYKKANGGTELQRGEKMVISIDCKQVANAELPDPPVKRQTIQPMQGDATVDEEIKGFEIPDSFVLIALGDLTSGRYSIDVQGVEGSTTAGYVYDRDGDATFASIESGVTEGQRQQISFQFPNPMFGVSVALNTLNNNTKVSWSLLGDKTLSQTSGPSPTPSRGGSTNGGPGNGTPGNGSPNGLGNAALSLRAGWGAPCAVVITTFFFCWFY